MEAILDQAQAHLRKVTEDPSTVIDARLLEMLDGNVLGFSTLVLDVLLAWKHKHFTTDYFEGNLPVARRHGLITQLAALLPTLQQDPTVVAGLATTLLESDDTLTFSQVLGLKPEIDLVGGLKAPSRPLNLVTLALLETTVGPSRTPADVGIVAARPELVLALVDIWLRTPYTRIAAKCDHVLSSLLTAESPIPDHDGDGIALSPAPGLMWRRLFKDQDVYGLMFSLCSNKTLGQANQLTKREKTIAQGRLLDLLQNISYAPQIWNSQIPEIEASYGLTTGSGLLYFAAARMVDYQHDVIMHMTLIDFFTKLIVPAQDSKQQTGTISKSSEALEFLISNGLHQRTMSYFLGPEKHDPLHATFLYSSASQYVSAYGSHHVVHFLESAAEDVLERLTTVLGRISSSDWANNGVPGYDLKLLSTLPQRILLCVDRGQLLQSVPSRPVAFRVLATVFKGSRRNSSEDLVFPALLSTSQPEKEGNKLDQAAARALFYLYISKYPKFWADVVSAAETTTLPDGALAALALMNAIITSNWSPLPTTNADHLPTERYLERQCSLYTHPLPAYGVLAVITPPGLSNVIPYLMKKANVNSEAAYQIAVAKHEALGALCQRLKMAVAEDDGGEGEHWADMLATLEQREREGPAGVAGGQYARSAIPIVGTIGR